MSLPVSHPRLSPLILARGLTFANRIVVPAMASETADVHGFVTDETRAHYRRLAESGAGLINVEYTFVTLSGRSEPHQLGASSDEHVAGLAEIATIIKASGAVAGLQLVHGGAKTTRELTGGVVLGPSAIRVPAKDRDLEVPTPMSLGDVAHWQEAFSLAAGRAVAAGFDLVELHAAHGYGLNQWLSPLTNQRSDAYGGDPAGRCRMLREIVGRLHREQPRLILAARIPGQDFIPGGLTVDDMIVVTRSLLAAGLDVVSVSSGLGGWRRPKERREQGYLVEEATRIQAAVSAPVIGVGGIETGEYIDDAVSQGRISLAAVGRAILKNPAAWRNAHLN